MIKYNKKIINIFKKFNEKTDISLEILIELFVNINENHLNIFFKNNYNNIPLDLCNFKNILFIDYFIKKDNISIKIYEKIKSKKVECIIKNIEDLYKYSLISFYISNEKKIIHNVFTIYDFRNMLEDVKTITFLEYILDINNLYIKNIYPNYVKSPLQLFYEKYICKNKNKYVFKTKFLGSLTKILK